MDLFDTHAHTLDESFDEDRENLLKELPENGMVGMIEIGCDVDWSKKAADLALEHSFIHAAAGVHPHEASGAAEGFTGELKKILEKPKVVAIGEIGLDYHYDLSPRDVQRAVFEAQLGLAKETGKPVIIHMRKASEDTMALLKKYKGLRGVMHCYSGSLETAKEALKLGFYISFSGSVTFKNAVNLQPVAEYVPLDRILAETDCPYLTPEPFRGRRNDPSKVRYVLEKLAQLKKISYDEICAVNIRNARELFGI
jgi:TatD DNase family protein